MDALADLVKALVENPSVQTLITVIVTALMLLAAGALVWAREAWMAGRQREHEKAMRVSDAEREDARIRRDEFEKLLASFAPVYELWSRRERLRIGDIFHYKADDEDHVNPEENESLKLELDSLLAQLWVKSPTAKMYDVVSKVRDEIQGYEIELAASEKAVHQFGVEEVDAFVRSQDCLQVVIDNVEEIFHLNAKTTIPDSTSLTIRIRDPDVHLVPMCTIPDRFPNARINPESEQASLN